jgi:hypothetical protein
MRSNGTGPRYVQLSARRLAYRKSNVEAWLAARTIDRVDAFASVDDTPAAAAEVGA